MLPSSASSRKQMRQRLKSRKKPRGRPHLKQRRMTRDANFGFLLAFATIDFFAINFFEIPRAKSRGVPKEEMEGRHQAFRHLVRNTSPVLRFSQSVRRLLLKNKAPYEARTIYARWSSKSILFIYTVFRPKKSMLATSLNFHSTSVVSGCACGRKPRSAKVRKDS